MSLIDTTRAILLGGGSQKAVLRPASGEPTPAIFGPPVTHRQALSGARAHMSTYGGGNAVDWVRDAVDFWATTASSATFHFESSGKRMQTADTPDGGIKEYPGGKVPSSLEGLLRQPNPFQTYKELLWLLMADLLLTGNGLWLKYQMDEDGRPLALYRLHPAKVDAIPGERKLIDHYEYHVDGIPEPIIYRADEVVHFKRPNPNDAIWGSGVIGAAPRVYDTELSLVETMAQFFERGAKLSGVLQSDRSVPEPLINKIRRQFATMYSGARNAYQVAVLERGLQFQSIQPTAAEAQFTELSALGRDRIFLMFGMHPVLVSGGDARPGLLEEAQRQFDNKHMRPFLDDVQEKISTELTHAWSGVDFKIDYEYTMPEKDRLTLAAVFSALPGVKVKEVREYVGLKPLGTPDDDEVLNMPGVGLELGGTPMSAVPGVRGGRPARQENMAGFGNTERPDARQGSRANRSRGALQKALESGDPEELSRVVRDLAPEADEGKAAEPPVTLTPRVIETLMKLRGLKKSERSQLVSEVERVEWPADSRPLRGKVIGAVAEGVRRGYSIEQIIEGVEAEIYPGVRQLMEEGQGNGEEA